MDYIIIEKPTDLTLENEVKKFLKKGWKLQGGVCVCKPYKRESIRFWQAMVKE